MFLPTPELVIETLRVLVDGLLHDAADRTAVTKYVTDDTPTVLRAAGELAHLLPGRVRAIEVVRDPRDVVASLRGSRWAPLSLESCADFYRVAQASAASGLAGLPAADVIRLRLEEVIAAPNAELGGLAAWLETRCRWIPVGGRSRSPHREHRALAYRARCARGRRPQHPPE